MVLTWFAKRKVMVVFSSVKFLITKAIKVDAVVSNRYNAVCIV